MTGCRVAVTGAAGFLGGALARRLLATPDLRVGGDAPSAVGSLQLLDLVDPPPDLAADPRVHVLTGELHQTVADLGDADLVCHLAGVVSGAAEADFDLGMRTNLDALRLLLERCRAMTATHDAALDGGGGLTGATTGVLVVGSVLLAAEARALFGRRA